jgi:hypothetical protein
MSCFPSPLDVAAFVLSIVCAALLYCAGILGALMHVNVRDGRARRISSAVFFSLDS